MILKNALIKKIEILQRMNDCKKIENPKFISAYTDASFLNFNGGWCMLGSNEKERILLSGPCPSWATNPNLAELCAVAGAIVACIDNLDTSDSNILIIKTDSQTVSQWFGWRGGILRSGRFPENIQALQLIKDVVEMCIARDLKLVVRWSKSHRKVDNANSYLSSRVDSMAKAARRSKKYMFWSSPIDSNCVPLASDWNNQWALW